jgi:hypothetical protein
MTLLSSVEPLSWFTLPKLLKSARSHGYSQSLPVATLHPCYCSSVHVRLKLSQLIQGNPTNVVLCQGFQISYLAFSAYTVFPFLACSVTGLVGLYLQFSKSHLPTRVTVPQTDPKSVLLDPVSAVVGSIALLATLALVIGTGFKGSIL